MTDTAMTKAAGGASILSGQSFITTLLGALFFMYMARALTKEELGVYSAVTLAYTIAAVIGSIGLNYAASRYIPYHLGQNDLKNTRLASKYILLSSSLAALTLACTFLLFSRDLSKIMLGTDVYAQVFQIAALLVVANIIGLIFTGFLQGIQRYKRLAALNLTSQIIRVSSSVILLIFGLGVTAVLLGYAFYYLLFIILAIPLILKLFKTTNDKYSLKNTDTITAKAIFTFALPMLGYGVVSYFSSSVDQFIVLTFIGVEALGVYTVAFTAAGLVSTIFAIPLLSTLMPSMSGIHGAAGKEQVARAFTSSTRYISMFFIPASLGLAALSPLAIHILAGSLYKEAILPVAIMSIGMSVYGFSTAITSALIALGETRKVMLTLALATLLGFAGSAGLTPLLDIPGAALGRAIMYISMFLILVYIGSRALPITFDRKATVGCSLSAILMAGLLYLLASLTNFNLLLLPAYLLSALIVYGIALAATRTLTTGDIKFLTSLLPQGNRLYRGTYTIINRNPTILKATKKLLKP